MNNKETKNDDLWLECPAGAIQKVADLAIVDRSVKPTVDLRRRNMLAAGAGAAGALALGGVAYFALRQPVLNDGPIPGLVGGPVATANYGGINCVEVLRSIPDFLDDKIVDAEKVKSIEEHLDMCDQCRKVLDRERNV